MVAEEPAGTTGQEGCGGPGCVLFVMWVGSTVTAEGRGWDESSWQNLGRATLSNDPAVGTLTILGRARLCREPVSFPMPPFSSRASV